MSYNPEGVYVIVLVLVLSLALYLLKVCFNGCDTGTQGSSTRKKQRYRTNYTPNNVRYYRSNNDGYYNNRYDVESGFFNHNHPYRGTTTNVYNTRSFEINDNNEPVYSEDNVHVDSGIAAGLSAAIAESMSFFSTGNDTGTTDNTGGDYDSGGGDYDSGGGDYDSGGGNYDSGGGDYDSGGGVVDSGGGDDKSDDFVVESGGDAVDTGDDTCEVGGDAVDDNGGDFD
ncbi:uncharacterized protein LOC114334260 [Diabrotica virgifera virgifera]|uniref:Uncharacterized protein LOC114334260 n=1 Tax=Diabrotica virgifera virgifera TaxID=50390 RepID=A0A6P7FUI3_DIAVI|nr:uncharacterized protein LOC114334260 [Diabrotica virgifera virgifera]